MIKTDDTKLAAELKGMRLGDWEVRYSGRGARKLYIRMVKDVRPVRLSVRKR